MQIFENEDPRAAGAQRFQKIAKLPQHPLARCTEHFILESRAFRCVDGTWQLQYPGGRVRANGRNQFRAVRPITVHQRIDEWQEDLVRSKPFGAAPIEQVEALFRQSLDRLGDEGRLADPGFSRDKGHLPLTGQCVPLNPVDRLERGYPADHQAGYLDLRRCDRALDLLGCFVHRADKAQPFARQGLD